MRKRISVFLLALVLLLTSVSFSGCSLNDLFGIVLNTEPTHGSSEPTLESTEPTQESTDPSEETTEPTEESTEPTEESTEPTEESTETVGENGVVGSDPTDTTAESQGAAQEGARRMPGVR